MSLPQLLFNSGFNITLIHFYHLYYFSLIPLYYFGKIDADAPWLAYLQKPRWYWFFNYLYHSPGYVENFYCYRLTVISLHF